LQEFPKRCETLDAPGSDNWPVGLNYKLTGVSAQKKNKLVCLVGTQEPAPRLNPAHLEDQFGSAKLNKFTFSKLANFAEV
jgi:hypothetical protein